MLQPEGSVTFVFTASSNVFNQACRRPHLLSQRMLHTS